MKKVILILVVLFLFSSVSAHAVSVVNKEIYYTKKTTLSYPKTYTIRFSLWDDPILTDPSNMVWSEEKPIALKSSKLSTYLGDTTSLDTVDFSVQLYVQVDRYKSGVWTPVGTRDTFGVVPYALWSYESGSGGGGSGTVTSVDTGTGLSGGPITTSGTISLSTPVSIANGGTGSTTKNFVDLTNSQTVGGAKTFSDDVTLSGNLSLPATTATTGIIQSNGSRLIHTYGTNNFFAGINAGNLTMTGSQNTASGALALVLNNAGSYNTASGYAALNVNTGGDENTANGAGALQSNTTGYRNTAIGNNALVNNTIGYNNTAIGGRAGLNQTDGSNNTYVGYNVTGVASESNVIRIGNGSTSTYIAGINGATSSGGVAVYVNGSGQLGTATSSRRFKEDIQDMGDATEGLMKLRPVTFYYKPEYANGPRLLQYGLIAEEVAEIYPDLVQYSETGEPNTVYYQFVNAMLLNEVQKQHEQIQTLEERLARLEALISGK